MRHNNQTDRREYFRIRDRLPLELRVLTREEFLQLEDRVKYSTGLAFDTMHELHFLRAQAGSFAKAKDDKLYAYLQVLDKKLDAIIQLLSGKTDEQAFTAQYVDVDIGGAGISFASEIPLAEGAYIELRIVLPVFPYPKVTALCEVVRKEKDGDPGAAAKVALKFLAISEKDRDCLINYVFLKERERLRSNKEEAGR